MGARTLRVWRYACSLWKSKFELSSVSLLGWWNMWVLGRVWVWWWLQKGSKWCLKGVLGEGGYGHASNGKGPGDIWRVCLEMVIMACKDHFCMERCLKGALEESGGGLQGLMGWNWIGLCMYEMGIWGVCAWRKRWLAMLDGGFYGVKLVPFRLTIVLLI